MRPPIDRLRVHYFLVKLGMEFRHPARVYLVGGTTMVADEHEAEFAQVIRRLKDELQINVEQASPGDFIPLPSGWKERAKHVGHFGSVDVFHFDLYSTALSKIERGREGDYQDVLSMLRAGHIAMGELRAAFENILPRLERESLKRNPDRFRRNFAALEQLALASPEDESGSVDQC
jgi:hypothetical protein